MKNLSYKITINNRKQNASLLPIKKPQVNLLEVLIISSFDFYKSNFIPCASGNSSE